MGRSDALDAKTGKQLYRADLTRASTARTWSTADGKIYVVAAQGRDGRGAGGPRVQEAGDEHPAGHGLFRLPAVADGRIYFRGYDYLWAIGTK